jgi:hypothetical protein
VAAKYEAIMIVDKTTDGVACSVTNGPGADIDAVEVRTAGDVLAGVGKPGTTSPLGAGTNACEDSACAGGKCKYSDPALRSRIEGPRDGKVFADKDDEGYFSLNNGRLTIQLGTGADGTGTAVELTKGMKIKVWEVDQSYIGDGAFAGCKCVPERYEVYALVKQGSNDGAVLLKAADPLDKNAAMCGAKMESSGCGTSVFMIP